MNEITSTEFRKTYHALKKLTVVTVNGHPIGTWSPGPDAATVIQLVEAGVEPEQAIRSVTGGQVPSSQAQRDDLLRKINRR
jgi:hypothetical protein